MEARPKIKIDLTQFDKLLEIAGIVLIIIMWAVAIFSYLKSPETVAIHFDGAGKPNGYGDRITNLLLPIIPTFIYLGLTQLNKYPHLYNYMRKITAENALTQYTAATRMIRILKLSIVLIFIIDTFSALLITLKISAGLGIWSLLFTILLLAIPVEIGRAHV